MKHTIVHGIQEEEHLTYVMLKKKKQGNDGNYFIVSDNRTNDMLYNYTYYFNLCSDVLEPPPSSYCYNNTQRKNIGKPYGYCPTSHIDESVQPANCTQPLVPITSDSTLRHYFFFKNKTKKIKSHSLIFSCSISIK